MTGTVTVVDYGVGNLLSVTRALELFGAEVKVTDRPIEVAEAERLVLPGVGAFSDGMTGLAKRKLIEPIKEFSNNGRPFLGICLGMQMMLDSSEEFGEHEGLGLIHGRVRAIPNTALNGESHKIPHIGWNQLTATGDDVWEGSILERTEVGESVYFVHSFHAEPLNKADVLALCDYNGRQVCAAIRAGNLFGAQFHPEKSGPVGLAIIETFLNLPLTIP